MPTTPFADPDRPAAIRPARIGRPVAVVWLVAVALTLLAVPAARLAGVGAGGAWSRLGDGLGDGAGHLAAGRLGAANAAALAAINGAEGRLEEGSPVVATLQPGVQWALTRFGGVGNEQALLGRDGWLFYRPGFDYLVGRPFLATAALEARRRGAPSWEEPLRPDPRPALLDFHRQLAERGIELVLLLVPTKAMVHPEAWLGKGGAGRSFDSPSAEALREELRAAGVELVDATGVLRDWRRRTGRDAFLRTDSHWSPAAVDAVAEHLSGRLEEMAPGFVGPRIVLARSPRSEAGSGDLARLLRLPPDQRLIPPEDVEVQRVAGFDGRVWQPERGAEVLLLGDSFSNVFAQPELGWGRGAGLAEQLAYHLQRPIDRLAINDGSATAVRRRLAADPERLASTRVVVYQIALREMVVGDWQPVELGN